MQVYTYMVNADRYDENSGMVRNFKDYFESEGAGNCEQSELAKECLKFYLGGNCSLLLE